MTILSKIGPYAPTLGGPNTVLVTDPSQMSGVLSSSINYVITGDLDWSGSGVSIEVPATGLFLSGAGQPIRSINVSDDDYSLFTSPVGGSGNLFISGVTFRITGDNSKVYSLTDATGFSAIEVDTVNYENCTSLGEWTNYRQGLEFNTGRIGGTPELTLSGSMGGFRIGTSIALQMGDLTSLFKAGTGLVFSGRFITDMRCDLPTVGAFMDFAPANLGSEELLQLNGCNITRDGVTDATDAGILPNITNKDVQSLFKGCTGIANTKKYLKANCTTEVTTTITTEGQYYPLEGVMTVSKESHISMPVNGEYQINAGSSTYTVTADIILDGTAGDLVDVRVTRSVDGGTTFPEVIEQVQRVINNNTGPRDVAFIPINLVEDLNKGDKIRLEVANVNDNGDVTMEFDSFISIKED